MVKVGSKRRRTAKQIEEDNEHQKLDIIDKKDAIVKLEESKLLIAEL